MMCDRSVNPRFITVQLLPIVSWVVAVVDVEGRVYLFGLLWYISLVPVTAV